MIHFSNFIKFLINCKSHLTQVLGGPLQVKRIEDYSNHWGIIAISSFQHAKCGSIGFPNVYTKVYPYLEWIEKKVWPNDAN